MMEGDESGTQLGLLCAGAVQGLVKALQPGYTARTGTSIDGRFGAVGAMKKALLSGARADVMIVTDSMIRALIEDGLLSVDSRTPIGLVRTGIAVRSGEPVPAVPDGAALKSLLLSSRAVFFPDPVRSTAGIHFAGVLRNLGILDELEPRFRTFPNGATAMRELAASEGPGMVGCTQVTEIKYTPGIALAGVLPAEFELATLYSAAIVRGSELPALAQSFIQELAGPGSARLRRDGGFDPVP
jgi:molybdate transport system substrate-binding protein